MMKLKGRPRRQFNYGLILAWRAQGKSYRSIAKDLGTSHTSIRRALARMPEELRKQGYREPAIERMQVEQKEVEQNPIKQDGTKLGE